MMAEISTQSIEPVKKSVTVKRAPADAFRLWTEGIASWWPVATHSVFQAEVESCFFEGGVGGRIYEKSKEGKESLWGTVTVWDPPRRVVYDFHPGHGPESAGQVEVRFTAVEGGTRVDLVHAGWEKLGERAHEARKSYDRGWTFVLDHFCTQ